MPSRKIFPSTLVLRLTLLTCLISVVSAVVVIVSINVIQRRALESQLDAEIASQTMNASIAIVGVFYRAENWSTLSEHLQIMRRNPNVLYTYVVGSSGLIDVGTGGFDDDTVGRLRHLPWEPAVLASRLSPVADNPAGHGAADPTRTNAGTSSAGAEGAAVLRLKATEDLSRHVGGKIAPGATYRLVRHRIPCPESLEDDCAEFRFAYFPGSVEANLRNWAWTAGLLSAVVAALSTACIGWALRRGLRPMAELTDLLDASGDEDAKLEKLDGVPMGSAREVVSLHRAVMQTLRTKRTLERERLTTRLKSALLHDFRGPASDLRSLLEDLAGREAREAQVADSRPSDLARVIEGFVRKVENLFIDLVTLDGGSATPSASVDAVALLERCVEDCRVRAGLPRTIVRVVRPEGAVFARAHEARLARALENVIGNALDAIAADSAGTPAGGRSREAPPFAAERARVEVSLSMVDGACAFRIRDDAPPIPDDLVARLFSFGATGGKPGGTGIGLFVARHIAREHGGDLELASNGPGGKEFVLTVPLGRVEGTEGDRAAAKDLSAPPAGTFRLLVVEDNPVLRLAWERCYLNDPGASLTLVDGQAGPLAPRDEGPFDVVVSDYVLGPRGPIGPDDAHAMRRLCRAPGLLVLHTHFPREEVHEEVKRAFDHVVGKRAPRDLAPFLASALATIRASSHAAPPSVAPEGPACSPPPARHQE